MVRHSGWETARAWRQAARAHLLSATLTRLVVASILAGAVLLTTASSHPLQAQATVSPAATSGSDWPTYLHDPQRTSASSETTLSPANVSQLTKVWSFKTGGVVAASPIVVGGTVYVGSWDGYEYALDAGTGALKWKTYLGVTSGPTCNPPAAGISSTAAVQGGVVYVGGGDAYWYALDAGTGAVLWRVYTGDNSTAGGHYNWASPLLYNGYAYIGVASLGDCPLVQGQLLQVSLTTHQVTNTFNVVPSGQIGGGIWASPSVDPATNTIYVTTGTENSTSQSYAQAILALDASTLAVKAYWKLPEAQAVLDSDFSTTPTLFFDATGRKLVAAINKNGQVYTFDTANLGAGPIWQQQIAIGGECPTCGQASVSSGAVGGGVLFLAGGNGVINGIGYSGTIRALDPATGGFLWQRGASDIIFAAVAYVNGLVVDGAGHMFEVRDATTGARVYTFQTGGTIYAAPSVSHGQIFTGGTDGTVYAFGLPSTPAPAPAPDANCPAGWSCQDIGSPTPGGSESVSGTTWTVTAGGSGVGGVSDQFRFIAQNISGDLQVSVQIASQQAVNSSSQAGLMVRQSTDPTSPYYAAFETPNNGLTVQYRTAFGGVTTVATGVTTGALPVYLELQRIGDRFQAATSLDGSSYTLVPGSTVSLVMPATVLAGVAVSSDSSGAAGTGSFNGAALGAPSNTPVPPPSPSPCPSGWNCGDIGNPNLVGNASITNGTWTVQGAGGDIWGTSDQFHYVWQALAADGSVSAHVTSQTNTDPWAKAGVMLRQSTSANAAYYAVLVTPSNGIVVQYRTIQGLMAAEASSLAGTVPAYLRVARSGTTFTAYTSADGVTWTAVGGSSIGVVGLTGTLLAGLAVTSHNANALSTVTFDAAALGAATVAATLPSNPIPAVTAGGTAVAMMTATAPSQPVNAVAPPSLTPTPVPTPVPLPSPSPVADPTAGGESKT